MQSSKLTWPGGKLSSLLGMRGVWWRSIAPCGHPRWHLLQMHPAHGDVVQCGSRHGSNGSGTGSGQMRILQPRSWYPSQWHACAILGPAWHQQQVLVLCDNMVVVQVILALSSRDRTLMHLLRCIHFFCAANNFKLRAKHIPGHLNVLADAISRNRSSSGRSHLPKANPRQSRSSCGR